jgi:hypothetical protein
MVEDCTLQDTIRAIAQRYGLKARYAISNIVYIVLMFEYSERKWKEKLKEWRFEKNISATGMSIIVAKPEKRVCEEEKRHFSSTGDLRLHERELSKLREGRLARQLRRCFQAQIHKQI